jgi:hypothetical protein
MKHSLKALLATAVVFAGSMSCVLNNPDVPELSGPSEMGTSVEMRAVPDQLVADGFSSSVIEAVVRDPNGQRTSGVTVLFDISRGGVFLDLGNLAPLNGPRPSAGGVESGPVSSVTDGDGVARARYWAPFRTDQVNDTTVAITGRPAGTDFNTAVQRNATIFLRAADRPSFPGNNACAFIREPNKTIYQVGEEISFTATQLTGNTAGTPPCAGNTIARYEWFINNPATGTYDEDRGINHVFDAAGTFTVRLTTTESITGCQNSCTQSITVVP